MGTRVQGRHVVPLGVCFVRGLSFSPLCPCLPSLPSPRCHSFPAFASCLSFLCPYLSSRHLPCFVRLPNRSLLCALSPPNR